MNRWSRNYTSCINCRTVDSVHKGRGLCVTCYDKNRNRKDARSRTSQAKYRLNNRDKIKESGRKYHLRKKEQLLKLLGGKCLRCGFNDIRALQIDHVHGGGIRERRLYNAKDYHKVVLNSLLIHEGKYQLLCANCNWIKRFENQEWGGGKLE